MPAPVKLRFHQATLNFLGHKAALFASAVKKIDDAEKKIGLKLPAAVREWYSLTGWEKAIANDRNRVLTNEKEARFPIGLDNVTLILNSLLELKDHIDQGAEIPLDRDPFTGEPLSPTQREKLQREREAYRPQLRVGQEPGNPYFWGVALDGSDDPPISETRDTVAWVSKHFSTFIFCIIWEPHQIHDWSTARDTTLCWLVAENHPCGPAHLDFLKEHYTEGLVHQSRHAEDTLRYPFYNSDGAISIQCSGDPVKKELPSAWSFTASSVTALVRLVTPMWHFGGLNKALRPFLAKKIGGERTESKDGEKALQQLKAKRK